MRETLRHVKALNYYYELGDSRGYPAVAREFTVSRTSVKKWAKEFDWQKRIEQRDIENAKEVKKKLIPPSLIPRPATGSI